MDEKNKARENAREKLQQKKSKNEMAIIGGEENENNLFADFIGGEEK